MRARRHATGLHPPPLGDYPSHKSIPGADAALLRGDFSSARGKIED